MTQTSDADLREFVVDFLRALGGGPDIKGSETKGTPGADVVGADLTDVIGYGIP
jgi:hypothetical protein